MKIPLIILLLLVLNTKSFSQVKPCAYCKKKITGEFVKVENSYFHPEHFLCSACNKPIEGNYVKEKNKFYHQSCARDVLLPKCDVCRKPLDGRYFQDLYGNRYHTFHTDETARCDNCDRLISTSITGGGKHFPDGRHLCNLCLSESVTSGSTYNYLLRKVSDKLRSLGLNIDMKQVSIKAVDRNGLRDAAGNMYNSKLKGFCEIKTETAVVNNRKSEFTDYTIYALTRIPSIYIEATLAHELMHIWLRQHTHNRHSDELEEGSCHFISYSYLISLNTNDAARIAGFMLKDQDPVYGGGLRKVAERFGNKYLIELLNYLKSNSGI